LLNTALLILAGANKKFRGTDKYGKLATSLKKMKHSTVHHIPYRMKLFMRLPHSMKRHCMPSWKVLRIKIYAEMM